MWRLSIWYEHAAAIDHLPSAGPVNPRHLLVALPIGVFVAVAYALRPSSGCGPGRLAIVRAAVLVGGYGVASTEALSAADELTPGAVVLIWLVALVVAAGGAGLRYRRDRADAEPGGSPRRLVDWIRVPRGGGRAFVAVIAGLLLAELVLALAFAPNTYDAQTYHLPRIEHWVSQRNVAFYAGI